MKCAPEIFPQTMDQMVEGLHGVEVTMDDVTVAGDETAHDTLLQISGMSIKMGAYTHGIHKNWSCSGGVEKIIH